MKKSFIVILMVVTLAWYGCQPDDLKPFTSFEHGDASSFYGTWNGVSANQRDIGAEQKGFPYKSEDLTTTLGFNNIKVTLNGTGNAPSTFTIDYGGSMQYFPFSTGNWNVDNVNKVGKIFLVNAATTDTITMVVGSYQDQLNNKLTFTQTKTLLGEPAIVYEYKFSK